MYWRLRLFFIIPLLAFLAGCAEPEPPKEKLQPPPGPFSAGTFDRRDDPVPATEAAAIADAKRDLVRMYSVSFVEARNFAAYREGREWIVIATPKPGFNKQKTAVRIGEGYISVFEER